MTHVKTIVILDWDDTLFPTYYYTKDISNQKADNDIYKSLTTVIKKLLHMLLDYVELIYVVTNAESGWIEDCIITYYPELIDARLYSKIVIYARPNESRDPSPKNQLSFKINSINDICEYDLSNKCVRKNIICIGDSACERDAVLKVAYGQPNTVVKIIQFLILPSPDDLIREIEYVANNFKIFSDCVNNFYINMCEIDLVENKNMSDIELKNKIIPNIFVKLSKFDSEFNSIVSDLNELIDINDIKISNTSPTDTSTTSSDDDSDEEDDAKDNNVKNSKPTNSESKNSELNDDDSSDDSCVEKFWY
jgi:hypothetical protein